MKYIHGAGGGGGGGQQKQEQPPKPTIAQDDANLKSISFAKLQFLLCEGEVEGPAFGNNRSGLERSVFLDNTAIRSDSGQVSPQPEDLVFSWGRQSSQQSGVPDYNRISQVESVDTLCVRDVPVSKEVTGSVVGGRYYATVLLTWQGLFQNILDGDQISGETGDVRTYSVSYEVRYIDSLGATRTAFNGAVDGKFSSTFQRSHRFQLQGTGPTWNVTVTRRTIDDDTRDQSFNGAAQTSSAFNFSTVVLSLDQKFNYAHSSMLSVGVRADRYSAIPNVSIEMKGLKIEIPSNYDPVNRTYSGLWDGTFKRAYSNNPAWVLRDLIINDRYGAGQYISEEAVDKWELYSIAQYCDQSVPGPNGSDEPRFTCNLLLQSGGEAWDVLQQLSSIFRGLLYYASALAVSAQDREKDPIFTFNEANTIEQFSDDGKVSAGNFTYAGTARRARHTVVLASWDDPDNNYETRIEYVTDDETFEAFGYRPIDLRMLGVTSRGQALRAANWLLLSERLLNDTITFSTNEIGMSMRPGDVIKIADTTKAAVRIGGRIKDVSVDGLTITLDQEPENPPGGWSGATVSWMYNDIENEPQLQVANVLTQADNVITIDSTGGNTPVKTFPWLIEFPNLTAQLFRVLTVEEQEGGAFSLTALRYRADIYNAVDFDTPLEEDESYLFKVVAPSVPTNVTSQVIWDNNTAKLETKWNPPANSNVLFEYDLTVESYRLQWQSGTVLDDGIIEWSDSWVERPRQTDDIDWVAIDQLSINDKFRVRIAAVGRLGVESEWSEVVVADDIYVWFPMPDISIPPAGKESRLTFFNQSSGSQLFTWDFGGLGLPPYVSGVRLEVKPNRPLTPREAEGIRDPDGDGIYIYGDYPLEEYGVCIFHADTNWECRVSFNTFVIGLRGETYATDLVDRLDLVPPSPDLFTVVTDTDVKSIAPMRRFSWALPTSEIDDTVDQNPASRSLSQPRQVRNVVTSNWPLGKVTDIAQFLVRYKAGFENVWELGVPLFADGVPGDQRYFETELFDGGTWTVMIRSVDRTGWVSDNQASVVINFGDAIPTNVVETFNAHTEGWPGQKVNMEVFTGMPYSNAALLCETPVGTLTPSDVINDTADSICTDAPAYDSPEFDPGVIAFDDANVLPRDEINLGQGDLVQIDPAQDGFYFYPFEVLAGDSGILITTISTGTYQWFVRRVGSDTEKPMYPDPQGDPMYPNPQTDYMYLDTTTQIGIAFHPYAPFEKLEVGNYEISCRVRSIDGSAPTALSVSTVDLDYPDVVQTMEDVAITGSNQRVFFPTPFPHRLKAVSLTLQDPAGSVTIPSSAYLRGKDTAYFDVRLLDATGSIVNGLVDVTAVGY